MVKHRNLTMRGVLVIIKKGVEGNEILMAVCNIYSITLAAAVGFIFIYLFVYLLEQ